jgi:hypothetical protein
MLRYETEIVVAADRFVCLQLPEQFPAGRAVVTVLANDPLLGAETEPGDDGDVDREDIEWWEEFEDDQEPVG